MALKKKPNSSIAPAPIRVILTKALLLELWQEHSVELEVNKQKLEIALAENVYDADVVDIFSGEAPTVEAEQEEPERDPNNEEPKEE